MNSLSTMPPLQEARLLFRQAPLSFHQPLAGARKAHPGFSLAELMVVVALISIMSGLAISNFISRAQTERLKSGTQSLAAWLDSVRQISIQQSQVCTIRVSGVTGILRTEAYSSSIAACSSNTPSFDLKAASDTKNIILCASSLGPSASAPNCTSGTGEIQLVFTPKGTSTTNALLQTHLQGAEPNRCIQLIAPLGLIRIGRTISGSCNWNSAG